MGNQTIDRMLAVPFGNGTGVSHVERGAGAPAEGAEGLASKCSGLETGWEVVVGRIVGLTGLAEPLVVHPRDESAAPMKARTVVAISDNEVGQQAVLAFEDGDLARPIVLGVLKTPEIAAKHVTVEADGDKFVVVAEREIVLRCGEASITLTHAGKVLIKGEYILTRSSGVNCIKGAAVSIN